jgi:hypothetical protein
MSGMQETRNKIRLIAALNSGPNRTVGMVLSEIDHALLSTWGVTALRASENAPWPSMTFIWKEETIRFDVIRMKNGENWQIIVLSNGNTFESIENAGARYAGLFSASMAIRDMQSQAIKDDELK